MNGQKNRSGLSRLRWYLQEHPDLLQHYTDLQGAVRRLLDFIGGQVNRGQQALIYMKREKQASRFPESNHRLAQLVLFIWGSLPRLTDSIRERLYRLRRRSIHTGNRRRALFERIKLHPALFLGGAVTIAAVAVVLSLYTIGTIVTYDGISMGTVASRRTVRTAAQTLEQVTRTTLADDGYQIDSDLLQTTTRVVRRANVETEKELEKKLSAQLGQVAYGYVLYVDGEPVAATEFEGALEELLDQLKVGYITPSTVECYFVEQTEIRQEYNRADLMMNLGYIAEKLNSTKEGAVTYTVQAGDTWYDIAAANQMDTDELLNLNPGYDVTLIHAGDVLTISNAVPYLTVVDVERQNYVQDVPYSVEYQDDSSMYEGDYEVLSSGVYGKAEISANVTYINGEETDREVVESVVLQEPVPELQARGTKERPSWIATGSLRWPCNGIITSYFGYRDVSDFPSAYSNHNALDIANSYGTGIYAADGGTVIKAGWSGGLGYAVYIDHGNGIVTTYGHNSSLAVSAGDHVYKGQLIAYMGSTGNSSGSHCHFAVEVYGTYVDPLNYLP